MACSNSFSKGSVPPAHGVGKTTAPFPAKMYFARGSPQGRVFKTGGLMNFQKSNRNGQGLFYVPFFSVLIIQFI
jgi:hypothetical protein